MDITVGRLKRQREAFEIGGKWGDLVPAKSNPSERQRKSIISPGALLTQQLKNGILTGVPITHAAYR
ncbi:uncharacterized protein EI90DRAFT_3056454 [Cantharellus anzutake]|uniref:uncharacterized protein n=1 Tax=Cantharellus anzutake TaxID=1750568 RepID=UPI0019061AFD|nr:uncharacterized protein EI90DRAFT_3056454 [Cantharellus anzutake]KAF8332073.1 hypothetical protein EI90DRAFT_3056454 [Cantharellus anzutake]